MKKIKLLVLSLLVILSMALLSGCGKVKEPTEADVREALEDGKYIDKDDKDDDDEDGEEPSNSKKEVKVKVTKCKLNDDKDKAKVNASVFVTVGPIETETEYKLEFKLKDAKEGKWKCKEIERGDSTKKLISGATDEQAETVFKSAYYEVENEGISGRNCEVKITKHSLNEEEMFDLVTAELKGKSGIKELEFTVEMKLAYSSTEWYQSEKTVTKSSSSYASNYKLDLSKDAVVNALKQYSSDGNTIRLFGRRVSYADVTFNSLTCDPADPNGSTRVSVSAKSELVYDNNKYDIDLNIDYRYTTEDGWKISYVSASGSMTEFGGVGKYTGKYGEDPMTVEISKDGDNYVATVTINSSGDSGKYSYKASVSSFSYTDDGLQMRFYRSEWIKEPDDGRTYSCYTSFYAKLNGDTLSNDKFSLKK